MNLKSEDKKRVVLICVFFSIFLCGTILMFITPISVKATYGNTAITSDGESISFNVFEPAGRESIQKPAVIIGHGIMANKEIMKSYAVELAAAGFVAVPFDFRGHGQSSGVLNEPKLINDVNAIKDYLASRGDIEMNSLGYIGYSMGGFPGNEIIQSDTAFKCFIGVGTFLNSSVRNGTSTNPLNVLMIQARYDEGFALEDIKTAVGGRIGLGAPADANKLYGSFTNGNASMVFLDDNTDHLLLAWDQDFVREARNWVINTFPGVSPVDENFYVNIRGMILVFQCFGGIGLFFLIIEPLSNLIVKSREEDQYVIELQERSLSNIVLRTAAYVLGLSVIGMGALIPLLLFLPLSIAGMMALFFFGAAIAIIIMFWRIGKKTDLSIKSTISGVFKKPKELLLRELALGVLLTVVLYVILYLTVGINYFAIAPYFIKILWIPPYYAVYFFVFIILGILFNSIIQPMIGITLRDTCKAALLSATLQILYFVIYILILSILIGSFFFVLTFIIAIPLLLLSSFTSSMLYQKTGNVISGAIVNTTIFVGIIVTLSPFMTGLDLIMFLFVGLSN